MDTHPYIGQMGLQALCACSVMTSHMARTILSTVARPTSVLARLIPELSKEDNTGRDDESGAPENEP